MNQQAKTFRRIVTGHNAAGKAVFISDAPPVTTQLNGGTAITEVWHTLETPALVHSQPDDTDERGLILSPPKNGTLIRVVEFPPEGDRMPHPQVISRAATVDYGIVLEGEITLLLDHAETTIPAGSVVIQNGTRHAWANRSGSICRMVFVLIDGEYTNDSLRT